MNEPVVVTLPRLAAPVDQLWDVLLDLGASPLRWTLIGGQMVLLHALEHGQVPPVISQDGDVVADVRADPAALRSMVDLLGGLGFAAAGFTTDGRTRRYTSRSNTSGLLPGSPGSGGAGPCRRSTKAATCAVRSRAAFNSGYA
jgi:hypothetical protein